VASLLLNCFLGATAELKVEQGILGAQHNANYLRTTHDVRDVAFQSPAVSFPEALRAKWL
jgi:hypothetical protein